MKFGICADLASAETLKDVNLDYFELPVTEALVPLQDDARFRSTFRRIQALNTPVEALNIFLPGSLRVTGPERNLPLLRQYARRALARARTIGAEVLVFGSGLARKVPDGFPQSVARLQILEFLSILAEFAEGVTIAIEPLNRSESNIINTVSEALELAREVDSPAIQVLADFYHMRAEGEAMEVLCQAGPGLLHVHFSAPDRSAPNGQPELYESFFRTLGEAGYGRRISLECAWGDFPREAQDALDFVRQLWKKTTELKNAR